MQDIHLTGTTSTPAIDTDWTSGRVSLRVDQGRGSLRLRVLPGAKGETKVDVISAALEGGETIGGVSGSHVMKLNSP